MIAWRVSPDYPLVVAANRDEFFDRPTTPATFWDDAPNVLAGRDNVGNGTWMGITRNLRFAALTNVREGRETYNPDAPSRGKLVSEFLLARRRPDTYGKSVARMGNQYNGYNLLVADRDALYYQANRSGVLKELPPGIYGLSNHELDTPWPKLESAKAAFSEALQLVPNYEKMFELLADDTYAPDEDLPDTGVGLEWERVLSAIFVKAENYGTRASTVISIRADNSVRFIERRYGPGGAPAGGTDVAFMAEV